MDKTMRNADRACAAAAVCVLLIAAAFILAGCIATGRAERDRAIPEPEPIQVLHAARIDAPAAQTTPLPALEVLPEAEIPQETESPEEHVRDTYDAEAQIVAKLVYGEAMICSTTERAAVIWCILNRVDSAEAYFPDDIIGAATQKNAFFGYAESNPVLPELYDLALDVFARWEREKAGETDVGRVLPAEYLYFDGDGWHNHFRKEYTGGATWDWSLPSPYEEG